MTDEELRCTLEAIFTRNAYLSWYCQNTGCGNLDFRQAAENFLERAKNEDVSPVRFFDPAWFRSLYKVVGPNAFLSYISDTRQRLAWPSPLFWPRWYSRRNKLSASQHPFLHYLLRPDEQSPHPLLDIAHLKKQIPAWESCAIAQAFITEIGLHRLMPHPQFDSGWYLDTNPDVAAAKMNPLEHYLYFGNRENRAPNHIFNVAWYKEIFLDRMPNKRASRCEPLTHYVCAGMWIGHTPAPGLSALIRTTRQTNYLGGEKHFRPQYTEAEKSGLISPTILRIEDGLQPHLASLERKHGLPPATFDRIPEIRHMFRFHNKQPQARWSGDPTEKTPFGQIPISRTLLTPDSVAVIYDLFREDFDAYGYRPQV